MIRKLVLTDYGKFRNTDFALGAVTVFRGDNESGKSTIFDALVESLTEPTDKRTPLGKSFRSRYGDERRCGIESDDGSPAKIPLSEMLGLYAIRDGDIVFASRSDEEWLDRVKASLFSGGVNPEDARRRLEQLASEKGTLTHNREIRRLEQDLSEARKSLEALAARRDSLLADERRVESLSRQADEARRQISEARSRLADLEKRLQEKEGIERRKRLRENLALVDEHERLARQLSLQEAFSEDRLAEYDEIAERIANLKRREARLSEEALGRAERMKDLLAEREASVPRVEAAGRTIRSCERLLDSISRFEREPTAPPAGRRRPVLVAAAVGIFLAVVAAVSWVESMPIRAAIIGLGAAALALLLLLWRARSGNTDGRDALLQRLADEYANAGLGDGASGIRTLAGLQELLVTRRLEAAAAETELTRIDAAIAALRAEQDRDAAEAARLAMERRSAEDEARVWLLTAGVADRDAYVKAVARRDHLAAEHAAMAERLANLCRETRCASPAEFVRVVRAEIEALDAMDLPVEDHDASDVQKLREQILEARHDVDARASELSRMEKEEVESRGLIRGSLGDLPESMATTENRIACLQKEIDVRLLDRRAAGLAASLLGEISDDTDRVFDALTDAVCAEMADLFGAERGVRISGFVDDAMTVEDATGAQRKPAVLSRGTRDGFFLAARLALARRSGWKNGVLLFDEAFVRLDPSRCERALRMVERFRRSADCQIVLFTKDEALARDAKRIFGEREVVEHVLSV